MLPSPSPLQPEPSQPPPMQEVAQGPMQNPFDEKRLLEIFKKAKDDCFENRWIWEREWLRDIYYTIGRQWIYYHPTRREWINKRLHKNVPRPVTNKISEIVQAIRASFGSIELGVAVRPVGNTPQAIAASEISDKIAPLVHEEHDMTNVLRECDFWQIVTGNSAVQISWDNDVRFNRVFTQAEQCQVCGTPAMPADIIQTQGACPTCGAQNSMKPAVQPDGKPMGTWTGGGRGKTTALSPFEYAVPSNIVRFSETPYVIRMRWRDRSYYEANFPELAAKMKFESSPQDRSLQIYKSLATTNDVSSGQARFLSSTTSGPYTEGITEYEMWMRPTEEFPQGLVMRVIDDQHPLILHAEQEGIPGPIPYTDVEGRVIFPFAHSVFEHVGGRFYGRSALSPLITKQDQINQIDSLIQQIIQRMANPVWIVPEGAGIDGFTGDPGLVLKYNPLTTNSGYAKPERIAGENVPGSLFQLRAQYLQDIEELSGAFDILKGEKPSGVEAFSALQLLVERSQARFTSAFASRGELYRTWYSVALELERQFGPDVRTKTLIGHNRGYTFQQFENAQLQGNVTIAIEDGTNVPKTALGKRAAIEHAAQLQLLNPADPEQRYTLMSKLGVADLAPSLDMHVQTALQMQDQFEHWALNPVGPPPLTIKPWFDPMVHYGERIKWLNTDNMKELMAANPMLEQILVQHLFELNMIINPPVPEDAGPGGPEGGPPEEGVGAGRAMEDSNAQSGAPIQGGPPQAAL